VKTSVSRFPKDAELIRDTDVYYVYDLNYLKNLVVSMSILHSGKHTAGHSHKNQEEFYIFLKGRGKMQVGEKAYNVKKGDIVLIKKGLFHKVFNKGKGDMVFMDVFERYKGRWKCKGK
jgi:mannose-6-phosphate isomerase-like protein (cupin superfamily)